MTEITFHADLYSVDAIAQAAEAYRTVADCDVQQADGRYHVKLTSLGEFPEPEVVDEFRNYVLGVTVEAAVGLAHGGSRPGQEDQAE